MKRSVYCVCLLSLSLQACAVQLKQASHSWEQPKPGLRQAAHSGGKNWGPINTSPVRQAQLKKAQQPTTSQRTKPSLPESTSSPWLIKPPDLEGHSDDSESAQAVLVTARKYLGVPYRYGGESPKEGFDCSGFVHFVYGQQGISMERTADKQYLQGQTVTKQDLNPGDLVFFSSSGQYVDHVGIYAGEQLFIHAPRTGRNVSYDSLESNYYQAHFRGARRLLK